MAGGRAQENRAAVDSAEKLDAHIHFRGVAQTARPQLHMLVAFAIGAQRGVVVHAAGHVGPVTGHDLAVSSFLEIENVEGFCRARDDVGSLRSVLR